MSHVPPGTDPRAANKARSTATDPRSSAQRRTQVGQNAARSQYVRSGAAAPQFDRSTNKSTRGIPQATTYSPKPTRAPKATRKPRPTRAPRATRKPKPTREPRPRPTPTPRPRKDRAPADTTRHLTRDQMRALSTKVKAASKKKRTKERSEARAAKNAARAKANAKKKAARAARRK